MNDIKVQRADSSYIFSFPHSGQMLIAEMDWKLKPEALKFLPNVDWHLNELYAFLENYNVNIVSTPHSRYVVDVNRPPSAQKLGNYRKGIGLQYQYLGRRDLCHRTNGRRDRTKNHKTL